jgi:hypothetical protein
MSGHGCKLPRLLRLAVEAYLEEPTRIRAAARTGIARSTLYVWMRLPEFQRLCSQIRQARLRESIRLFQAQAASEILPSAPGVGGRVIDSGLGQAVA